MTSEAGPPDLPDFEAMNDEHKAWQDVVMEFHGIDVDVNEPKYDRLIRSIEAWGEQLVALRRSQDRDVIESARAEKLGRYAEVKD